MLDDTAGVLAAVSGGADSVVLLDILSTLRTEKPRIHVAHLDHMLRGRESAEDAEFVRSLADSLGLASTIRSIDVGAVAKAGSTAMTEVYQYAEPVTAKGFVVMDTPGFDPPSVTGLMAGGCNVICFTTGRGSCIGLKPTPSIKIASNTPMYQRMVDDMDINSGEILHGQSLEAAGREIFEKILAVASGEKTKSEIHGIGDEEFVPWQIGAVM